MASSTAASSDRCARPTELSNKVPSKQLKFPKTGFEVMDPSVNIEEENLPYYDPTLFYPVHIGDTLQGRYQVTAKFGYGSTSTTWLCKDLIEDCHVVLKIYIRSSEIERNAELECIQHLQHVDNGEDHPGRENVRFPDRHFTVEGPGGTHDVFVLRPLGFSVRNMQRYTGHGVFDEVNVVHLTQSVVTALEYLQMHANLIHCDVHSGNLHLTLSDESVLYQCEKNELSNPSPRKITNDGRIIHVTQDIMNGRAPIVLCDFSSARICVNDKPQHGLALMPEHYRPPEIILGMPWSYPVDIWCLGITAWRMLHTKGLFAHYTGGDLDEARHLALMVGLLGPPPLEFLKKSEKSLKYWDEKGRWRGPCALPPPAHNLESICTASLDNESKAMFLDFIRKMLHWDPEERLSPGAAWSHPWVYRVQDNGRLVPIDEWEKSQNVE